MVDIQNQLGNMSFVDVLVFLMLSDHLGILYAIFIPDFLPIMWWFKSFTMGSTIITWLVNLCVSSTFRDCYCATAREGTLVPFPAVELLQPL